MCPRKSNATLLDERAQELAKKFSTHKPNKILIVSGSCDAIASHGSLFIVVPIDKCMKAHIKCTHTHNDMN